MRNTLSRSILDAKNVCHFILKPYIFPWRRKNQRLYLAHVASEIKLLKGRRGCGAGGSIICYPCSYTSLGFHLQPPLGQDTHLARSDFAPPLLWSLSKYMQAQDRSPEMPEYYLTAKPKETGWNQVQFQQRRFSFLFYNNYLLMGPNLENMISRSSSVVTGFSLHTNSTFSGGLTSASGKSPTCGIQKTTFITSA